MRAAEITPPKCWAERGKFLVALLYRPGTSLPGGPERPQASRAVSEGRFARSGPPCARTSLVADRRMGKARVTPSGAWSTGSAQATEGRTSARARLTGRGVMRGGLLVQRRSARARSPPLVARLLAQDRRRGVRHGAPGLRPPAHAIRRARLAGDVLSDRDGAFDHERNGLERTPWHAVQGAARDALRRASAEA